MNKGLTGRELELLQDKDFLLSKALITEKLYGLLKDTKEMLQQAVKESAFLFPPETDVEQGKISKGENYRQLPFIVLDYPRSFSRSSVFAFRTLFTWGGEFSCTLHLQGEALEMYRDRLWENYPGLLLLDNTYICVNSSPWEYHFGSDNYMSVNSFNKSELKEMLLRKEFIKLSRKLGLDEWERLPAFAGETFKKLVGLL